MLHWRILTIVWIVSYLNTVCSDTDIQESLNAQEERKYSSKWIVTWLYTYAHNYNQIFCKMSVFSGMKDSKSLRGHRSESPLGPMVKENHRKTQTIGCTPSITPTQTTDLILGI